MNKRLVKVILFFFAFGTGNCIADEQSEAMAARINQQLKADGRDKYDAAKDPGRKPVETMQFFDIKAGATVLDMITGAGYNAEILSAAVGPKGIVYAQNSHFVTTLIKGAHHKAMLGRVKNNRLPNVRYMVVDAGDMPFDGSIDTAFWGFNMHDVYNRDGEAPTIQLLNDIKRALKPGGILAISEHVGIAGNDNADLHRLESKIVFDMIKKAGFVIDETSELLANPDDDHSQSIYADGLRYNTDRILVRARKPAE
jgi:predicted methyltransferase